MAAKSTQFDIRTPSFVVDGLDNAVREVADGILGSAMSVETGLDSVFENVPLASSVGVNQQPFADLPLVIENAMAVPILGVAEVFEPIAAAVLDGKADAAIRQVVLSAVGNDGDVDSALVYMKDIARYGR